jgi:chromosome partitioning protein
LSKIIAVCNQKGGVGKTTTAVNLSAYLADLGKTVLLIDTDPQGNATSGVGVDKNSISQSIYHVIIDQTDISNIIIPTSVPGLSLAPADLHLTGAQIELVTTFGREQRLKKGIQPIKEMFDLVVIDCPPNLGLLTINALTASDTVLIPLQCEYYAMEGLSQLLHTIQLVQENLNPSLSIEGVVLTMADYRTNLTNEVIKEAREFFKERIYDTVVPRSIRLSEAPGYGKPILLYDKHSHGAESYKKLAEEFMRHNSLKTLDLQQNNQQQIEEQPAVEVAENTNTVEGVDMVNNTEQSGGNNG